MKLTPYAVSLPLITFSAKRLISAARPLLDWVQDDQVQNLMNKFDRSAQREYTVITPLSPLEDLEAFLENNLFALGASVLFVLSRFGLLMY